MDASVVVKWLLREADSSKALQLRDDAEADGVTLIAPPVVLPEATSAIYKRVQQGSLARADALDLIDELVDAPLVTMLPPSVSRRALEIAAEFQLKWIYDAFYVALAEIVECDLWTADETLHSAVRGAHANVKLLAEYSLG